MTYPEIPQNHMPNFEIVEAAYSDVLEHNKRTGLGGGLASLLGAILSESTQQGIDEKLEQTVTEVDMQGELQGLLHEDTFMRIGIYLAPLGSQLVDAKENKVSSAELIPIIQNPELFIDFLKSADSQRLQESDQAVSLMAGVMNGLWYAVATCYGEKPKDDVNPEEEEILVRYGEDALRTFLRIDETLKEIGADDPLAYQEHADNSEDWNLKYKTRDFLRFYETLQNYTVYWGRDLLPEYIKLGAMKDLAHNVKPYLDGFQGKLFEKIADIKDLAEVEKTHEFGVEAAQAMLSGINGALAEIEEDPEIWFAPQKELLDDSAAILQSVAAN